MTSQPDMQQRSISIIGAGLSGLTLARCLKYRSAKFSIYEREAAEKVSTRHSYGITLHPWAYQPLLPVLGLDEATFRQHLAVDGATGGRGYTVTKSMSPNDGQSSFRANRSKLEQLLRKGLDVQWDHKLVKIEPPSAGVVTNRITFENELRVDSDIVISADGAHSQVRKSLFPKTDFSILPFAVYNGKRRVSRDHYDCYYASTFAEGNVTEHRVGHALLQISINDISKDRVSLSYTYSRQARQPDPLFRPTRPNSGAQSIPDELFDEIRELHGLSGAFQQVFNVEAMRKDRLLNWLMRSVLIEQSDLESTAKHGVILMADAAHHTPILSGQGANLAIKDAIELAEFISTAPGDDLSGFYDERVGLWAEDVAQSEARIAAMHGVSKSNL